MEGNHIKEYEFIAGIIVVLLGFANLWAIAIAKEIRKDGKDILERLGKAENKISKIEGKMEK